MGLYRFARQAQQEHIFGKKFKISNMKKIFIAIFSVTALYSCTENKSNIEQVKSSAATFSTDGKKVIVYSTADSTNLRLSSTDTLNFKDKGQPFENEVTVFVDPSKSFQTYFGIGAALTDASAETFYKTAQKSAGCTA